MTTSSATLLGLKIVGGKVSLKMILMLFQEDSLCASFLVKKKAGFGLGNQFLWVNFTVDSEIWKNSLNGSIQQKINKNILVG